MLTEPSIGGTVELLNPYRMDLLVLAALLVNAVGTGIVYSLLDGFVALSDPVLAALIEKSVLWLPIYRLLPILLLPAMPDVCRQTFASFYLAVGILFGVNDGLEGAARVSQSLTEGVRSAYEEQPGTWSL